MPEDAKSPPASLASSLRDEATAKLQKRMRDVAQFFPRFVIEHILDPIEFEEDEGAAFEGRTRESIPLHENVNAILKSFRQECAALEERLQGAGQPGLAAEIRRAVAQVKDTGPASRVGEVRAMLDGAAGAVESAAARLA